VILDEIYADEVKASKELFDLRRSQGRAATDVSEVARWATYGAVDTLFVDIDETLSGSIDEASGEVQLASEDDAINDGIIDEIARRAFLAGGRVLAVRAGEVPGDGPIAAILRYAPMA
jgi:stalled ribosome rescue protein Dom34